MNSTILSYIPPLHIGFNSKKILFVSFSPITKLLYTILSYNFKITFIFKVTGFNRIIVILDHQNMGVDIAFSMFNMFGSRDMMQNRSLRYGVK